MPAAPPRKRRSGARAVILILLIVLAVVLIVGGIAAVRYVPLLRQTQDLRATASELAAELRDFGIADLEGEGADRVEARLTTLDEQLEPFRDVLANDPLVGVARQLPVVGEQVVGADRIVGAADQLVEAGTIGMGLADRFKEVRARNAADPSASLMAGIVELMATSVDEIDQLDDLVAAARAQLADVPAGVIGQLSQARDLMAEPLDKYGPLLADYRAIDQTLPGILGWDEPKRYLVLAQNPAELRPTGGYAGTIGVITLDKGQLVERRFFDVFQLDTKPDLPFVEPPEAMTNVLLGEGRSWLLADANWSPHFPTSAEQAIELYSLESGDTDIDGVIAITTYALDRILEVTGPVAVPEFDVTVKPGDVTLTILGATRESSDGQTNRKAVLDALAEITLDRLLSLPSEQWIPLFGKLEQIGAERLALAWFKDPAAQELVAGSTWAGEVRQDPGDYLGVVEANVAPTGKYNLVVSRSSSLDVTVASDGSASGSLRMDWQNDAGKEGEPYASLRRFSNSSEGLYGAYVRVLVPEGAELITANGQAIDPIRGVESVGTEAGRTTFANYLLMEPGASTLTYFWRRDGVAEEEGDGTWVYRLTVQKQPGTAPEPLRIVIRLPEGATVVDAPEGMTVDGDRVSLETTLTADLELAIAYTLAPGSEATDE